MSHITRINDQTDIIKQDWINKVDFNMIRALIKRQSISKLMASKFRLHQTLLIKKNAYPYSQESKVNDEHERKLKQLDFYVYKNENVEQIGKNLSISLNKMKDYLDGNAQKINSILNKTTLKHQQIKAELECSISQLNKFLQKTEKSEQREKVERVNLLHQIQNFISEHPSNKSFMSSNYEKMILILEVVIKLKNILVIFKQYGITSKLLANTPPPLHQITSKLSILELKNGGNIQKQYLTFQKIMYIIGGLVQQEANILALQNTQSSIFWHLFKNIIDIKQNTLATLEMHFRGETTKLIKQINFMEQDYMKPFTDALLPSITTNQIIYVPINDESTPNSIFRYSETAIPVRILYHSELAEQSGANLQENIMFHIHGGGFVGMSSNSTQCYTRAWANQSKLIMFSIDYSLAPKHPFPHAINDIHRVYDFILRQGCALLKITPKNIYIGGDSAGGNLSCSLTAVILKKGLPIPKGLFLVYPYLDARHTFYGSRKWFLTDPALWPSFAKIASKSYLNQENQLIDPLASPLLLTQGYINGNEQDKRFPQRWPTTYIHVGSKDPLRDESLIFVQKMHEAKIPCKCTIVSGLRHGYLQTQAIIPSSKGVVQHSAVMLSELVEATTDARQ